MAPVKGQTILTCLSVLTRHPNPVKRPRNSFTNPSIDFCCNLLQLHVIGTEYLSRSFWDTTLVTLGKLAAHACLSSPSNWQMVQGGGDATSPGPDVLGIISHLSGRFF
jgi:hypothetical protein